MLWLQEPLPAVTERSATDHLPPSRNANDPSRTRPKVLLVDDDGNDIFLTRKALEGKGCDVVAAKSVTEALRQIGTQSFDVLITDLHMPEAGDGFAVVTAMRHTQPEALTLVVSAFPEEEKAMASLL